MTEFLKKPMQPQTRNYDNFVLVRLLMAMLVMITHFGVLTDGHLFDNIPLMPNFAIASFFVISGYVITASFDKLPVMRSFYAKRFFRMYPLYALAIVLQLIAMSAFFWGDLAEQMPSIGRYFVTNMLMLNFLQYDIGGLLKNAINPGINPSLWTLKIEVMFYAAVPFLHMFFVRFRLWGLVALYVLSTLYTQYLIDTGHAEFARQLPGAVRYIVVGMALYFYRKKIVSTVPVPVAASLIIAGLWLLMFHNDDIPLWLYPLITGPLTILMATRIYLPRPKVDLSYGVYLVHAPLIQFSLLLGIFHDTWWFLGLLTLVACGLAYLGYRFIEVPGVNLGQRISKAAAMTAPKQVPVAAVPVPAQ